MTKFSTVIISEMPGATQLIAAPLGGEVRQLLDHRISQINDFGPPLTEFAEFLIGSHIPMQIQSGGTPETFPALSPRYKRWKDRVAPGMPILILTGKMTGNFGSSVEGNDMRLTNTQEYARYHQTGTARMPPRKWLQIQNDEFGWKKWRQIVRAYIVAFRRFR